MAVSQKEKKKKKKINAKAHRPAPCPRRKHGGGWLRKPLLKRVLLLEWGVEPSSSFDLRRAASDLPPIPLGQTLGCCGYWREAVDSVRCEARYIPSRQSWWADGGQEGSVRVGTEVSLCDVGFRLTDGGSTTLTTEGRSYYRCGWYSPVTLI
jgi:hypothetical protein